MPTAETDTTTLHNPRPEAAPEQHRALAAQIDAMGRSLTGLAAQQHAVQLLRMVDRPGWTTRHEADLVSAMVNHLQDQLTGLHRAHDTLLAAADSIGRG